MASRRRVGPRSVRARSALAAGAASAVLFTGGALWTHHQVRDQAMATTRAQAQDELARLLEVVGGGALPSEAWGDFPYEVTAGGSRVPLASSPDMEPFERAAGTVLPPPGKGGAGLVGDRHEVRFGRPPGTAGSPLAGRTFTAVSGDLSVAASRPRPPAVLAGDLADDDAVRVYVVVTPFGADRAAGAVDRLLAPAVPAAVLVVAGTAYLATRRALRPVEAIRARTAAVTASDPRERVDVPDTGDEIAALAVTINATLERLDRAASEQRRFVADAAHELRSPVAGLLAALEVSLAYPERTDWPAATEEAAGQARRLQTLAEDLLLLARLDAGSAAGTAAGRAVDLRALASGVVADHAAGRAAGTSGPQVVVTAAADPAATESAATEPAATGAVEADPTATDPAATDAVATDAVAADPAVVRGSPVLLERVLRNLLDNAVRHARTRVEVAVARVPGGGAGGSTGGAEVVVRVSDDGDGVPPADRERVFDRFTRLDAARDRGSGGAGLGLAIARDLAARHGGTLAVDPAARSGACFVLRLPAAEGPGAAGTAPVGVRPLLEGAPPVPAR
ncbi:HAMP domain-containing histidine kinase [Streptacidiphilus sp. ASG 303]|uniref:sensor histidine kinase n=1 Tax=Streptacidiphilus sp. ASG 303 TaxID=2896847 RepID=UPI001E5BE805|nr:HAMP domain-containing sensor histidine kinase [Streptacidiphilus sp. ASG 303]MCD0483638.1 HAMP domain-containing histidine kinase [Streptacidiphilus sp. ASG 303]